MDSQNQKPDQQTNQRHETFFDWEHVPPAPRNIRDDPVKLQQWNAYWEHEILLAKEAEEQERRNRRER